MSPAPARQTGGALFVALGILLSRLAGLARQRMFAHFLGTSAAADAWNAAFKIPNLLQNLLGEGVLSASFIPVYASLRTQGPEGQAKAREVAGAVAALLGLLLALFVLLGVTSTPFLIDAIAPGFTGERRELTIQLVRIFFPGIALLVLSAFCIGVLNSHRRFFLSYAAPVIWNCAQISALLWGGHSRLGQHDLALWAAWGSVAGALLQLLVQLPQVLALLGGLHLSLGRGNADVKGVLSSFFPVLAARGVVQVSAFLDSFIASWLPLGAVAALGYAQTLYLLPISLFGMSISAAALPSMSESQGDGHEREDALRAQVEHGLRNIAFPVIPTVIAFLVLGQVACAALFQTGRFGAKEVHFVGTLLAASSLGVLSATLGRIISSAFYALRDTRTPLRIATIRVGLGGSLGLFAALWLPAHAGFDPLYGAAGLSLSSALAGIVEFFLLRRKLEQRIGAVRLDTRWLGKLWAAGLTAAALASFVWHTLDRLGGPLAHPLPRAAVVLGLFGATY
ncbi:MAG: murein biosynthesis integral membrane protein MurJ, partial [Deltaproteobacteria bacterium]|nr:murein biosynthesis integral membrane protein MurJ [Deltaproteobacteria bacterium]